MSCLLGSAPATSAPPNGNCPPLKPLGGNTLITNDDAHQAQEAAARFASSLYDLADWLADHDVAPRTRLEINHPLHTVEAVEAFAADHGLTVTYDDSGKGGPDAEATIAFGPASLCAYGYVDAAEARRRAAEHSARRYAAENGLALVPAEASAGGSVSS